MWGTHYLAGTAVCAAGFGKGEEDVAEGEGGDLDDVGGGAGEDRGDLLKERLCGGVGVDEAGGGGGGLEEEPGLGWG